MEKKCLVYIIFFLIICSVPSLGLLVGGGGDSAESADTADKPLLVREGKINVNFLGDAGAYFEDNFAFRNECVTGYAYMMDRLFGVSAEDDVIVGTDGWLYYKDSLDDYQGADRMTDRQLFDLAHSLALIKQYAGKNNIDFVFCVAPNKNSLYGEHMPYYYRYFRDEGSNLKGLVPYLETEGIEYADLYGLFSGKAETLYHKRDSHWNNKGAAMAADEIFTALGREHVSYENSQYNVRKDYEGDLDKMLYPAAVTKEEEIYFDSSPQYTYVEEVESNFAPKIHTESDKEDGSLVMYRDSFGNALLPFMAQEYKKAYFSRTVPYQIADLKECQADTLVIECAERFLPERAANPPVMEAYPIEADALGVSDNLRDADNLGTADNLGDADIPDTANFSSDATEDIKITPMGETVHVEGKIKQDLPAVTSRIYVKVNEGNVYEAFPKAYEDGSEGFLLVLPAEELDEENNDIRVYLTD